MSTAIQDQTIQTTEEAWLAERKTGVTATDAPVIAGCRGSAYQLWAEKRGLIEPPDLADREWIRWGHLLEPVVLAEYAERTGREVIPWPAYTVARHPDRDWLICTPDAEQIDGGRRGALEVKTAGEYRSHDWDDEPPLAYQVQLQHQLAVLSLERGTLAVLIGGNRLRWFDAERNEPFIRTLLEVEEEFWFLCQSGRPPPVDGSEATARALAKLHPADTGESVILPEEAAQWDRDLQEVKAAIKDGEAAAAELENRIKAAIGDATYGILPDGSGRWSWKTQQRAEYTVKASSFRVLRRCKA